MAIERVRSTFEVLERVLDKGIVIDGWLKISLIGLDLIGVEGRVVVASLPTYAKHARTVDRVLGRTKRVSDIASRSPAISTPAEREGAPEVPPDTGAPPLEVCPRCQKHGRRQDLVLLTLRTRAETRLTARCSVCRWQRTYAG